MKPGWSTTEFWGKVVVQVIGLLLLLGVITPGQASSVPIDLVAGLLAMVAPEVAYAISRGLAKRQPVIAPAVGVGQAHTTAPTPALH